MALGSTHKNNGKLFILKLRTADAEKKPVAPHFEITEKVDDKWVVTGQVNEVSGTLTKVETYEKQYEGDITPLVKVFIEDKEKNESYLLDLRYNMLSRNLFNTLISLETFGDLKIGLWERKKDDKTYPAISLRQSDKMVNWKFEIKDLPPVDKVIVGKKTVTSFDNLNDFFIEKLKEFSDRVKNAPRSAPVSQEKVETPAKDAPKSKKVKKSEPAPDPLSEDDVNSELDSAATDDIPF